MNNIEKINKIFSENKDHARCIKEHRHRHFAFYDIELEPRARVSRISRRRDEISLAIQSKTEIIVKKISEQGILRLQTTTEDAQKITFDNLYRTSMPPQDAILPMLFGETDEGKALWVDIAKMPHLLVGGSTGSGKSGFLQMLIANAAKRNDTKLFLIDTKRVEFNSYRDPALQNFVYSVDNDFESAMVTLQYLNAVMKSRYKRMAECNVQSIEQNPMFDKLLLIIDEAADLMLYDRNKTFEKEIAKLAQLARAAGIYMVFATQRPDVSVVTGLIKANFPARLACKVTSKVDSKVVLDRMGAEALAGRGDALFSSPVNDFQRFQVAYVEPREVITKYKSNNLWQKLYSKKFQIKQKI